MISRVPTTSVGRGVGVIVGVDVSVGVRDGVGVASDISSLIALVTTA